MIQNKLKIGVIGVGHMGSAIIEGLTGDFTIIAENHPNPRVKKLADKLNFIYVTQLADLIAEKPDVVFLTTPAPITLTIAKELRELNSNAYVLSCAAGIKQKDLQQILPQHKIAALIPNIPVAINAGTIGISYPKNWTEDEQKTITDLLSHLGDVIPVQESQLSIVGTIGGCGPAFVDVFMDALADSGVLNGLSREQANQVAASMVKGAGSLAIESNLSPAILRDQVCSPGGTTIRGVASLEENGFRHAVIAAVNAANHN